MISSNIQYIKDCEILIWEFYKMIQSKHQNHLKPITHLTLNRRNEDEQMVYLISVILSPNFLITTSPSISLSPTSITPNPCSSLPFLPSFNNPLLNTRQTITFSVFSLRWLSLYPSLHMFSRDKQCGIFASNVQTDQQLNAMCAPIQ